MEYAQELCQGQFSFKANSIQTHFRPSSGRSSSALGGQQFRYRPHVLPTCSDHRSCTSFSCCCKRKNVRIQKAAAGAALEVFRAAVRPEMHAGSVGVKSSRSTPCASGSYVASTATTLQGSAPNGVAASMCSPACPRCYHEANNRGIVITCKIRGVFRNPGHRHCYALNFCSCEGCLHVLVVIFSGWLLAEP